MCIENCINGAIIEPKISHTSYCTGTAVYQDIVLAGLKKITAVPSAGKWNFYTRSEDSELHCIEI